MEVLNRAVIDRPPVMSWTYYWLEKVCATVRDLDSSSCASWQVLLGPVQCLQWIGHQANYPCRKNVSLREKQSFPSATHFPSVKNRALGEASLPRVLHSRKNCTRGRRTHEKEKLSRLKKIEKTLPRVPRPSTRGRWPLPRVPTRNTRGRDLFPECLVHGTRGRTSSPSA
jgi:hypothetical protein